MDRFEAGWEHDAELDAAPGPGLDPDPGPTRPSESPATDADGRGGWPESVWSPPGGDTLEEAAQLFADPFVETELRREMRLSELWERCEGGSCTVDEFFELSTLISEVDAIRGALCVDCAVLNIADAPAHWALATTTRCREHLRLHLCHARLDGEGPRPG